MLRMHMAVMGSLRGILVSSMVKNTMYSFQCTLCRNFHGRLIIVSKQHPQKLNPQIIMLSTCLHLDDGTTRVQWNLNNPATYGPGFIGRNNEVAGVQC